MIEPVKIGDATLYLGDCLEVLPLIGKVDAVVTDPPYSSGARRDADRQIRGAMLRSMKDKDWFSHDTMTSWGFSWFLRGVFIEIRKHLTAGAHVYIFIDWRQTPNIYGMLESTGYRVNHCLVWAKTHFGMGAYWRNQHENIVFGSLGQPIGMANRGMGTVLNCAAVSSRARLHPTEKPVDLIKAVIGAITAEVIFDPFMGSGTAGVACAKLGRKFIGIEIEPKYFDIVCERIKRAQSEIREKE